MALDQAIIDLTRVLGEPVRSNQWAATVRARLATVNTELDKARGMARSRDGWLSARERTNNRERRRLRQRVAAIGPRILDHPESETSMRELRRVAVDLEHYRQRLHDLVYDAVALELGGSE